MKLSTLRLTNFRRLRETEITFAGATFLIGPNNYGKSSVLRAIELLLTQLTPDTSDFYISADEERAEMLLLEGLFTDIDDETSMARGFRGRVKEGIFRYRKTFFLRSPSKPVIECLEYPYELLPEYEHVASGSDLVAAGIPEEAVTDRTGPDLTKKFKKGWERDFLDFVVDFDEQAEPRWIENPGGIPGNVTSRFPRVLHVPPLTKEGELGDADKKSLISDALGILFEDLLAGNDLAESIQTGLTQLQEQMSPDADDSLIRGLCSEVNTIIGSVFPDCGIEVAPSLQDLNSVLKPRYSVSMFSNTSTDVGRQGTGLLRTAVFAMLRYHTQLKAGKEGITQPLLVAFEEPELYLHPAAASLLRETIYAIGQSDQIVCTTHSPWMIDLSKDLQSLTKMALHDDGSVGAINYDVSRELSDLQQEDRSRVKMLQVFDAELSRVFFTERVVVVEGDTEEVVFKATCQLLNESEKKRVLSTTHLIKARGKAAIISLVKYLRALAINPAVIHDRDAATPGAAIFNQPIADVADAERLCVLCECIEDVLGYKPPSADKPYAAYRRTAEWSSLDDVPDAWFSQFIRAVGIQTVKPVPQLKLGVDAAAGSAAN